MDHNDNYSNNDIVEIDLYELLLSLLQKWWLLMVGLITGFLIAGIFNRL